MKTEFKGLMSRGFLLLVVGLMVGCMNEPLILSQGFENEDLFDYSILFTTREQYVPDHHNSATFYPNYDDEYNDGYFVPGSALKMLTLVREESGEITRVVESLLSTAEGLIRDPEISADAKTIVFSMRKNFADSYHIYLIDSDGENLKQLTFREKCDDLDPAFTADGSIVFTSTRENKYIHCNRHISAAIYKMDGDGANIHRISQNTLFDNNVALMPDGRILYSRWEYVDRNFGDAQGLWSCNPDGTNHAIVFGNNTASPGGIIDARVIPGTDLIVSTFSSCHDRPWGGIGIIDKNLSVDGPEAYRFVHPPRVADVVGMNGVPIPLDYEGKFAFDSLVGLPVKYEDPYPISETLFLVSRQFRGEEMGLSLLTTSGAEKWLYREAPGCYDPILMKPTAPAAIRSVNRSYDPNIKTGEYYISNVYEGTHMEGVEPGEVKYLRVVEAPSKLTFSNERWEGQGAQFPAMAWSDFYNKIILGEVPVEADGSVYFEVPSETFFYFQLLDKDRKMVQSMRSGTHLQPGETASCIGCHESRTESFSMDNSSIALSKPINKLKIQGAAANWDGAISYLQDIQPVWDRNCLDCHDFGGDGVKAINLAGDKTTAFNVSYSELWKKNWLDVPGAGGFDILQPKSWGSNKSRLVKLLELGHAGVKLPPEDLDSVITWIDLNAPYYPTYTSAYPDGFVGRSPLTTAEMKELASLTGAPLLKLDNVRSYPGFQITFDRPELSPCLRRASGEKYDKALKIIQQGAARLEEKPREDMVGYKPSPADTKRLEKHFGYAEHETKVRQAITDGEKLYEK